MLSLLPCLHLFYLLILDLAQLGYKNVKRLIRLARQTIFRRATSPLGSQSSFAFREASTNVSLPHSTFLWDPFLSSCVHLRNVYFFFSWHNSLTLLSYFSYFPFSVPMPFLFHLLWSYQYPSCCISVLENVQCTASACTSIGLSEQNPSPGSSARAETQKVSGDIQNHWIIWVMSRASKQRFQTEGGFPVCRRSASSEDGVEHLQLRGSSDAVSYLSIACPTQPGAVREELGV